MSRQLSFFLQVNVANPGNVKYNRDASSENGGIPMKTLYLDCGMGAAGDMLTAAQLELILFSNKTLQIIAII